MGSKKKYYYVVWVGVNPGVYDNWNECKVQIQGYPNAKYKKFNSKSSAEAAFYDSSEAHIGQEVRVSQSSFQPNHSDIITEAIAVDAACSGNPGVMEYRGVYVKDKVEIFRKGPFQYATNNIGEFLALVHVLAFLDKKNDKKTPIYSDSKIAIGWVKKGAANTKLKPTPHNKIVFKLMERGANWLSQNQIHNKIIKWKTAEWGEIPADFGRK